MKRLGFDPRIALCAAGFILAGIIVAIDEIFDIPQRWGKSIVAKATEWLPQSEDTKGMRSPHFWIITALMAFCTLLYYVDQTPLVGLSPFNQSFLTRVHDIHRILFFIPVVYAALAFRVRGSLIVSFAFLCVVLPRALLFSPYPDPLLRPLLFVSFAALISLLLATQPSRFLVRSFPLPSPCNTGSIKEFLIVFDSPCNTKIEKYMHIILPCVRL